MRDKEIRLVNKLNELEKDLGLELVEEQFSVFDAVSKDYIVEFKIRDKHYDEHLIEVSKAIECLNIAEMTDREFLYIVGNPTGIYVANVTKQKSEMLRRGYKKMMCPATTEFSNTKKIEKNCYFLLADKIL